MKDKNITPGENLKNIRESLGLKQYEITGGKITRNLISLIENNKTPLYEHIAKLISENINKLVKQRSLDIFIYPIDILNPEIYEKKKIVDEYINRLESYIKNKILDLSETELNDIEYLLSKWDMPDRKAKIYELLGDIFHLKRDQDSEYSYYMKSLVSCFFSYDRTKSYKLIMKLGATCINLKKYYEAIRLNNLLLSDSENVEKQFTTGIYYNNALAYKKLKDYEKALLNIEQAEKYLHSADKFQIKNLFILKANCFKDIKQYVKAINIYKELIESSNETIDCFTLLTLYINLADTYKQADMKIDALTIVNYIISLLPSIDINSIYLSRVYFELANLFEYLQDNHTTEKYLKLTLQNSKNNNEEDIFINSLLKLFDFYYSTKNYRDICLIKSEIEYSLSKFELNNYLKLLLKFIFFNIENNNVEEVKIHLCELLKTGKTNEV